MVHRGTHHILRGVMGSSKCLPLGHIVERCGQSCSVPSFRLSTPASDSSDALTDWSSMSFVSLEIVQGYCHAHISCGAAPQLPFAPALGKRAGIEPAFWPRAILMRTDTGYSTHLLAVCPPSVDVYRLHITTRPPLSATLSYRPAYAGGSDPA